MNALRREMERKRKALQEAKKANNNNGGFVKAGELRRLQDEQREAEREAKREAKRQRQLKRPLKNDTDGQSSKKGEMGQNELSKESSKGSEALNSEENKNSNAEKSAAFDSKAITQQLRRLGLPVRLFGERGDESRNKRLQQALETKRLNQFTEKERSEYHLEKGHRIQNSFLQQQQNSSSTTKKSKKAKEPELHELDQSNPHHQIYIYFHDLLQKWKTLLEQRSDLEKHSVAGKKEATTMQQCHDYIQPLFSALLSSTLAPNMLAHLQKIVNFAQQGEFVQAHDAYMDVAIGRAAWPIGVTMVGIHARTGRSKIESANVAHVMNSELQRKYLTSIKRLLTLAQKLRTDVDPSKKVG